MQHAAEQAWITYLHLDCQQQVNHSPYDEGWLMKVKVSGDTDKGKLMDASEYEKQCTEH